MINANELRIGNWVQHNDIVSASEFPGTIFQWSSAHWFDVERSRLHLGSIDPITLSPEVLEKCGCKYFKSDGISSFDENNNDPDGVTHCWTLTIKRTELVDSHEISIVKWGEQEYFTFQLGRGTYRQKIKNLHQLQNLYFALTGQELIYKP